MTNTLLPEIYEFTYDFLFQRTPYLKKLHPVQVKKCVLMWFEEINPGNSTFSEKLENLVKLNRVLESKNFSQTDKLEKIASLSLVSFSSLYEPYIETLPRLEIDSSVSSKISHAFGTANTTFTEQLFLLSKYVYLIIQEYVGYINSLWTSACYLHENEALEPIFIEFQNQEISTKKGSILYKLILSRAERIRTENSLKMKEYNRHELYRYIPFNDMELPSLLETINYIQTENQKVDISSRLIQQKLYQYYTAKEKTQKSEIIQQISSRYEAGFIWQSANRKFKSSEKFPIELEARARIFIEEITKTASAATITELRERLFTYSCELFSVKKQSLKIQFTMMRFVEAIEMCDMLLNFKKFVSIIDETSASDTQYCEKIKRGMDVIKTNNDQKFNQAMLSINKKYDLFGGRAA